MIIGIDIGNTHIVTGVYDGEGKLISTFRIATNDKMTEDEYFSYFNNITKYNNISIEKVDDILVSSVVPNIIITFQFFARKYFKVEAIVVDLEKKIPFTFAKGINYTGFGADRIIDITEAMQKYPNKNLVIFDFGTATPIGSKFFKVLLFLIYLYLSFPLVNFVSSKSLYPFSIDLL